MLDVAIYNLRQHRQFHRQPGPLVLARAATDAPIWTPIDAAQAELANAIVKIEPRGGGLELAMTGCEGECYCGTKCGLTGSCKLDLPARFSIGDTHFEIFGTEQPKSPTRPLQHLHKSKDQAESTWPSASQNKGRGPSPETLSKWFTAIGNLNHWATSLQELFVQAAKSAVETIGLDGAIILRRRDEEWDIAASHLPRPELGIHFDLALLDELLKTPETMFHGTEGRDVSLLIPSQDSGPSTLNPCAPIVIAPLRSVDGKLAGAIYGYRSVRDGNGRRGIRYLEANLIELLAGAVSDGITRLCREAEVDRHRALIDHAFVDGTNGERQRIIGEEREVTLLFADLRDFTRLSAELTNDEVYELLGQIMDCLTSAVMDHDGLVIDYYGDGLAAMWNAPADQAEHPELACRAALKMLNSLPEVAADWRSLMPAAGRLRLGIGVHTGMAQVGNAGSRRQKKYGPRGGNVHLVARVEAATKKLVQPLLVSGQTARRLSNRFTTIRVCRAALPGIEEPVDLHSVWPHSNADLPASVDRYKTALTQFESGELESAANLLRELDPATTSLPVGFLLNHIESSLNHKGRRQSDQNPSPHSGAIRLNVK